MWLHRVQEADPNRIHVNWKSFSLEQVNGTNGPEWKVWDQLDTYESRSLTSLRAGKAAKLQGSKLFEKFHLELLTARHGKTPRISLSDSSSILKLASKIGLDMKKFETDMNDRSLLETIARDHIEAVEQYGVFGTPTFVFPNGASAFVKMIKPPAGKAARTLELLSEMMSEQIYIGEIKRPQPPWPKGAFTAGQ